MRRLVGWLCDTGPLRVPPASAALNGKSKRESRLGKPSGFFYFSPIVPDPQQMGLVNNDIGGELNAD